MALSEQQVGELRTTMQRRRDQLLDEIDVVRARASDNVPRESVGVPDSGDEAAADLSMDVDHHAVERDTQEVRAIDAALGRIDDGSYGSCVDCGQDIAFERLAASPTATRCVPCQERYEKTYASNPTPSL